MADVSVRPARPEDAPEVARVQLATWQAAYADVLPADALSLDPAAVTAAWEQALVAPPSPYHRLLVALDAGQVVGLASCEPAADEDLEEAAAELSALLVEPRWGRRGHGSRLLTAAVELWRADGVGLAVTWVFESDEVVAGFLASAGWGADATSRSLEATGRAVRQRRWQTAL